MADSRKKRIQIPVLFGVFLCLAFCTASGVFAYLISRPDVLINRFDPASVSCSVEEEFENDVKRNVKIRNTGNVDAYIRVVVVATFQTQEGHVLSVAPKEGVDYTVSWSANGWEKGSDGFWYYRLPVSPNGLTANLIESATVLTSPENARLNLQIVASALQTDPATAVERAWGITPVNGEISPQ